MIDLYALVGLALVGALWDVGRRWAAGKSAGAIDALRTELKASIASVRDEAIGRCDKNTAATENMAKNFAEWRQNIEHKMVAFGINRPPKGPHAS